MNTPIPPSPASKVLWFAVAVLFSALIATYAGILLYSTGESVARAVLYGWGAFAGTMTLVMIALKTFGPL